MIQINLEKWKDCKEDVKTLIHDHWEEVAWYKDKMELAPLWDKYDALADSNIFYAFIARNTRDEIIGYALYFVAPSMHYDGHTVAENDILYIKPTYRHCDAARELINYCQITFQTVGVSVMTVKMKTDNTFHGLMEQTQFSMMEYNYTKWIGG